MKSSFKKLQIGAITLLLCLAGLLIAFVIFRRKKTSSKVISEVIESSKYSALAPYWIAVSQVETGNFTSNLFKKNNNGFGFTFSVNDPYAIGYTLSSAGVKWAKYASLADSARSIVDYMDRFKWPTSVSGANEFVGVMKSKKYFAENEADYLKAFQSYL